MQGLAGFTGLKLPEQEESLRGKDLKDLAQPGAEGKEITAAEGCAETELCPPMLNLIKRKKGCETNRQLISL